MNSDKDREYLAKYQMKPVLPPTVCKDGFTISIQGSKTHYCIPRNNQGPYEKVELGFPSGPMPEYLKEFQDSLDSVVYGYVPVELVEKLLQEHGGRIVLPM